ncbi:MAG: M20/M25/M40 family metallo-hydrolase [Candidatus Hodarchaeales archaeon]|jgi:putative aminopeptidase FrvX
MESDIYEKFKQNEIINLFSELLAIPSPSGMESNLADHIYNKCAEWGYNPKKDFAGNVYVHISGQKDSEETCCLAAHTDEIGLMVTKINSDGTLDVERVGGTLTWKFGERPVEIYGEKRTVQGITAMGSGHSANTTQNRLEWKDVKIITGLSPEKLESFGIKPGTLICPIQAARGPILFGEETDPMIAAWTFDDKMGIVALLRLLKSLKTQNVTPFVNLIISFTTSEEIGCFGAKYLARSLNPTYFIAVDGCPFASHSPMELDNRPGIRIRDRTYFYSRDLIKALSESANIAGTDLQHLVYTTSGSDAGMVGNIGASPHNACIGHIRKNSHGFEVAYLSVFENLYKTLLAFITSWKGA